MSNICSPDKKTTRFLIFPATNTASVFFFIVFTFLSIQATWLDYSSSRRTILSSLLGCTDWHALRRSAGAVTITERSYRRPF
jgi:hypothetical protein